jgi:hypothetical protein
MKSVKLAKHNNDLKAYCATLLTSLLTQMNTQHSSKIVPTAHFNQISIKYFLKHDTKTQSSLILFLIMQIICTLSQPLWLYHLWHLRLLPARANQEHITALNGMLQKQQSHMHKIVASVSHIDNQVKQRLASFKSLKNGG